MTRPALAARGGVVRALTPLILMVSLGCGDAPRTASTREQPAGGAPAPADAASGGPRWRIGMSQCNLGEPWRVQMDADVRAAAAAHPELEVVFKDAQNDTLKQRAHVEELVAAGVDVILISPKEAAPLTEPVARAMAAGIPVVVLDRRVLEDRYTTFVGADNVAIGRAAGEWLAKTLGGRGKVVELQGLMTSTPAQDRHRGFREGIAASGIEVVLAADMKWLEPDARREMESALARFAEIDAVYAHNDPGAHGAYLAARAAGRDQEMLFVGIDALPHEGVMYVKQGILDATFQYPTGGREAVDAALAILRGETPPREITLGSRVFTADNVDAGGEPLGDASATTASGAAAQE
jgi:ribose transport system substrate-binding protein